MRFTRILMVVSTVFFLSCDPSVTFHRIIENNSDYTLQLVVNKNNGTSDTTNIEQNQEIEFLHEDHRGRRSEHENCENRNFFFDSIHLIVKDDSSKTINADPIGKDNWVFSTSKKTMNGGGYCNCRLIVTNSMIE